MDNLNEDKAKDPAPTDGEWLTIYDDRNDSKTKKCEVHANKRKLRINGEDEVSFKYYKFPLSMLRVLAKNANSEVKHSDLWEAYRERPYIYTSDYDKLRKDKEKLCKLLNTNAPISVEGGWGELIDGSEMRYELKLNVSNESGNNRSRGLSESLTCPEKGASVEAARQTELEEIRSYFLLDLTPSNTGSGSSSAYVKRNWLCSKVNEWLDNPEQRVLLIQGGPGTGKSCFAKHEVMNDKRISAFVSFRWKDPIANSARYASEAIAYQLAEHNDAYRQALLKIVRREKAALSDSAKSPIPWKSSSSPFSVYVTNILKELPATEHGPFVVALDGLDEFSHEALGQRSVNTFADIIAEEDLPSSLKLLIFARNDDTTIEPLKQSASASLFVLEDHPDEASGDIHAYVKAMLKGMSDDVIASVVESSKSSFLYASLVCRGILAGDIDGTSELPTSLAAVYRSYFDRVTGEETFGDDMRAALCALCSSPELVPEKTLRNAVGWTKGKVHRYSSFMRLFGMYLESDGSDGSYCLTFFHKSLSDFLVSEEADDYMVDKAWGCELLAKACYIAYQGNMEDMNFFELSNIIPLLQADEKGNSSEIANILSDTDFADFVASKADSRSSQEDRARLLPVSHMIYRSNMHLLGAENLEKLARISMLLAETLYAAGADSVRIEELHVDAYEAINLLPKGYGSIETNVLHLKSLLHIFDIASTLPLKALSKDRLDFECDWLSSSCVDEKFELQLKPKLSCWDLEVCYRLDEDLHIGEEEFFYGDEGFFGGCGSFFSNRFLRAIAERLDEQERGYTYDYAACVVARAEWLLKAELLGTQDDRLIEKAGELLAAEADRALAQRHLSSTEEIFSAAHIMAEYAYYLNVTYQPIIPGSVAESMEIHGTTCSEEWYRPSSRWALVANFRKSNRYATAAKKLLRGIKSLWPLYCINLYHIIDCLIANNILAIRGIDQDENIFNLFASDFDTLLSKCAEHQDGWIYIDAIADDIDGCLFGLGFYDSINKSVNMFQKKSQEQKTNYYQAICNPHYRIEYILAYAGMQQGEGYLDAVDAITGNRLISRADKDILLKLAKAFRDLFPAVGFSEAATRLKEARICIGSFNDGYIYDPAENALMLSKMADALSIGSKTERAVILAHFLVDLIASHGNSCGFDNDEHNLLDISEAFAESVGRYLAEKITGHTTTVVGEFYRDGLLKLEWFRATADDICRSGESDVSLSFGEFFSGKSLPFDANIQEKVVNLM